MLIWHLNQSIDFIKKTSSYFKHSVKHSVAPMQLVGALYNWTDDLPNCELSGVGSQTNLDYNVDEGFVGIKEYEDRSFKFQCPDECCLYGIIDGHNGSTVGNFTAQKLPAELLLGQLKDNFTNEDVKEQLMEAFGCLSKAYLEDLINDALMEKMSLEDNLMGIDREMAKHRFPTMLNDLQKLDREVSCGCSVVMALIHKSKLFIANVGDARALLCRRSVSGELGFIQLSTDHTISTVSELQRLANLGIDIEKLQYYGALNRTRSIGDWASKGGYRSHEFLCSAKTEPILSTPSIHGGEKIDASMQFFILMSKGVYKAYEEATGAKTEMVNNSIASMVNEEIKMRKSPEDVAQSVINRISTLHYEQFEKTKKQKCTKRDDMTLLVRVFSGDTGSLPRKGTSTISRSSRISKKSRKLAPLKMPDNKDSAETKTGVTTTFDAAQTATITATTSDTGLATTLSGHVVTTAKTEVAAKTTDAVTSSSEGNTPVTSPVNTPGSSGSDKGSPQFSHPFSYHYRSPSPLTTTVKKNPNYEPLHIEVDERPLATDCLPPIIPMPRDIPPLDIKPQEVSQELPYVLARSGMYHPLEKDGYSTSGVSTESEQRKVSAVDPLLIITDRESDTCDSESSGSVNQCEDKTRLFNRPPEPLETDEEGKIKPYVDFTEFNNKIKELGGEEKVFASLMSILG